MTEKTKPVVLTIDSVRIVKSDEMNYSVEKHIVKDGKTKWQHKGYVGTIRSGLAFIVKNELLVDKNTAICLSSYLKQVTDANEKVMQALKGEA